MDGIIQSESVDAKERQNEDLIYAMIMCQGQMNIKNLDERKVIESFRLEEKIQQIGKAPPPLW